MDNFTLFELCSIKVYHHCQRVFSQIINQSVTAWIVELKSHFIQKKHSQNIRLLHEAIKARGS